MAGQNSSSFAYSYEMPAVTSFNGAPIPIGGGTLTIFGRMFGNPRLVRVLERKLKM